MHSPAVTPSAASSNTINPRYVGGFCPRTVVIPPVTSIADQVSFITQAISTLRARVKMPTTIQDCQPYIPPWGHSRTFNVDWKLAFNLCLTTQDNIIMLVHQ